MSSQELLLELLCESLAAYNSVLFKKLELDTKPLNDAEMESILTTIIPKSKALIKAIEYSVYKSVSENIKADIKLELMVEMDIRNEKPPVEVEECVDSEDNFDLSNELDNIYGKLIPNNNMAT